MGYIRANDTSYPTSTGLSWTISLWFRADHTSGSQTLFFYGTTVGTNAFVIYLANGVITVYTPGATVTHGGIEPERWYHLAYTHDGGTSTHRLYLDGQEVDSSFGGITITLSGNVYMGWDGVLDYFHGNLRDVMVFRDLASQQNVNYLYQNGCAVYERQTLVEILDQPLDWWPLDECQGTQVANNFRDNPGTVIGGHSWQGTCPCIPG